MVPGRDGLSILRQIRERGTRVPVILLTARASPNERVEGLDLGADDYLPKPFYMDELIARMHAILRRSSERGSSVLRAGDLTVNLLTREVARGDQTIELSAREFALLTCLMHSPGRVFTRTQLCERVWNYHHDPGTNLVDVYIQRGPPLRFRDDLGEPSSSKPCAGLVTGSGRRGHPCEGIQLSFQNRPLLGDADRRTPDRLWMGFLEGELPHRDEPARLQGAESRVRPTSTGSLAGISWERFESALRFVAGEHATILAAGSR